MTMTTQQFSLILLKIFVCSLLTLMVSYPIEAEESSTGPFPIVEVDLNAGVFKNVLPFDVPFLITGQVTNDISEVSVRYFESDSVISNKSIQSNKWKSINPWRRFRGFEGDKFNILVPPLEVNRYFRFEFSFKRSVTDTEVEAFRRSASDAVDRLLRSFGEIESLSVEQSDKLRAQLISAVKAVPGPGAEVSVEPGTIFDEEADSNAVMDIFIQQLGEILHAQNNKYDGIASFAGKVPSTADHLNELIRNPVFGRTKSNLQAHANQNKPIATLLKANEDAIDISVYPRRDVNDLAAGLEPGSPMADLDPVWDAVVIDDRINQLMGTIRTLNNLNRFVSQVRSASSLRVAAGVTADELNGLSIMISGSVGDFQEIQGELAFIKKSLESRKEKIDAYISQLGDQFRTDIVVNGTSVGDLNTRHAWYVSADVGLAWAWDLDEVFSYFGTNIYFRPVNKNAPLKGFQFFRRFSIMIGLTLQDLKKSGQQENVIGSRMLVVGAGLRFTSSMRVTGGALVFKEPDPNPLISDANLALSPFISLSFDWDVASTLGSLGRAFGITK